MLSLQYLIDLVYFVIIVISPVPLCLSIAFINSSERYKKYNKNQTESLSFSKLLLIITTGWCVISTVVCLLLGILGWFNLRYVIYFDSILFLGGILIFRYLKINKILPLYFQNIVNVIQSLTKTEWLILISICFVGLVLIERSVTRPLIDYDSLWYHLPNMVSWYQSSSLKMVDPIGEIVFDQTIRYPYNWELLSTLLVLPFREDFLVTLTKVLSWFILGVSIYRISLQFGASRLYSLAASSLVLTMPFMLFNVNTMQIDIPLSAFFMASLSLAIDYSNTRKISDLGMFALCLGMLLGIKASSIIYAGLLVAIIVLKELICIVLRPNYSNPILNNIKASKFNILPGIIFSFFSILLGFFWYIRNFLELGNPLGYVQVNLANFTVFPGLLTAKDIKASSLANLFELTNLSHWQIIGMQALVRLQLPFIAIILQIIGGLYVLITRKPHVKYLSIIGITVLLIATGWLYWNTPGSGAAGWGEGKEITAFVGNEFRYGFSFLCILGIAAAMSATLTVTHEKIILIIVSISTLTGLVTYTISEVVKTATFTKKSEILWASQFINTMVNNPNQFLDILHITVGNHIFYIGIYMFFYMGLIVLIYCKSNVLFSIRFNINWHRRMIKILMSIVCILILMTTSIVGRERRDMLRKEFYGDIYNFIEENIFQEEMIGYFLSQRSYLFYGKNWDRKVVYAAPNSSDSLAQWVNELQNREISVLAVGPVKYEYKSSRELPWLEAPNGLFIRVFGEDFNRESVIYRLN